MTNAKNISIKSFLAERGINPKSERAGYGMYLSPLRQESTPSFKVDYNKNLWYDFGIGEGGSILDLVMRLDNCTIAAAYNKLEGREYYTLKSDYIIIDPPLNPSVQPKSTRTIDAVLPLENPNLLRYLKSRAIDIEVAQHFCREIHYSDKGKSYYAIGFGNDRGGWELRNEYFKTSSSPKTITSCTNFCRECLLFEGFMDFLSYKTLEKESGTTPPQDAIILNSVGLLSSDVITCLLNYERVHLCLDNDVAGRAAVEKLRPHLGDKIVDRSTEYADCKDLNEWLQRSKAIKVAPPKRALRL